MALPGFPSHIVLWNWEITPGIEESKTFTFLDADGDDYDPGVVTAKAKDGTIAATVTGDGNTRTVTWSIEQTEQIPATHWRLNFDGGDQLGGRIGIAQPEADADLTDEWTIQLPAAGDGLTVTVNGGSGGIKVAFFLVDTDMAGGDFANIDPWPGGAPFSRTYVAGLDVLVCKGSDFGVWTLTASGPCTPGPDLALNQTIHATFGGWTARTTTANGSTVAGVTVSASDGQLSLAFAAAESALAAAQAPGDPYFDLGAHWGQPHGARSYLTDPVDFTTGVYLRATVEPGPVVVDSGSLPSTIYTELFSWTHDADTVVPPAQPGSADNIEWALSRTLVNGQWRNAPYAEWSEIGAVIRPSGTYAGFTEAHSVTSDSPLDGYGGDGTVTTQTGWRMPEGVATDIALTIEFDRGDGRWQCTHWRRVYIETPDATFDGANWKIVTRAVGESTTSVDTIAGDTSDQWGIGRGSGGVKIRGQVTIADIGDLLVDDTGTTVLASPAVDDAITAGATNPFDDPQSNTWAPQDTDLLVEPTDSIAALVARIEALENP